LEHGSSTAARLVAPSLSLSLSLSLCAPDFRGGAGRQWWLGACVGGKTPGIASSCHCPIAFSVPDAGENVNTYGRAVSTRIPFAGADNLSGRAWDNFTPFFVIVIGLVDTRRCSNFCLWISEFCCADCLHHQEGLRPGKSFYYVKMIHLTSRN
jgi:hypothetical protein